MMLEDLRTLFAHTSADAARSDYGHVVIEQNVLGKPTKKARELAFRHLCALYDLDIVNPIFRALRRLWPLDEGAQPLLALAVALARDPLLRNTQELILNYQAGATVARIDVEAFIDRTYPHRFSAASLKSFAQNIGGTWTSAGFLAGRSRKIRAIPQANPESVAILLFLGFLEGRTGQRLFSSEWMRLLNTSPHELEHLASSASHRGLLVFMNAGGVKEVRFPDYLTSEEEQIRLEISHVV